MTEVFPKESMIQIRYGDNRQAFVASLNTIDTVSIAKTHEILTNMFDIPLSAATIKSMVSRCAANLNEIIPEVGSHLTGSNVDNAGEIGIRVEKPSMGTCIMQCQIHANPHPSKAGMESYGGYRLPAEIPRYPYLRRWPPYWKFPDNITNAVCCEQLLRELTGIEENHL